jgi:hypothetical protein
VPEGWKGECSARTVGVAQTETIEIAALIYSHLMTLPMSRPPDPIYLRDERFGLPILRTQHLEYASPRHIESLVALLNDVGTPHESATAVYQVNDRRLLILLVKIALGDTTDLPDCVSEVHGVPGSHPELVRWHYEGGCYARSIRSLPAIYLRFLVMRSTDRLYVTELAT